MDPSRLTGLGKKGSALDLSVLSTIESHMRSGIPAFNSTEEEVVEDAGAKATTPDAIMAKAAREREFMS